MKVLVIADDESLLNDLPDIQVDVLISCGDLPDWVIQRAAERCGCRHVFAVKGNHDGNGPFPEPISDLHLRTQEIDGVVFGGFAGAWKYKPRGHHLYEQDEVHTAMAGFPTVDVFVTHNSPRGVHDREDEVHLGFTAFGTYLERMKLPLMVHGHQHLNEESRIGGTRVIGTYGWRILEITRSVSAGS